VASASYRGGVVGQAATMRSPSAAPARSARGPSPSSSVSAIAGRFSPQPGSTTNQPRVPTATLRPAPAQPAAALPQAPAAQQRSSPQPIVGTNQVRSTLLAAQQQQQGPGQVVSRSPPRSGRAGTKRLPPPPGPASSLACKHPSQRFTPEEMSLLWDALEGEQSTGSFQSLHAAFFAFSGSQHSMRHRGDDLRRALAGLAHARGSIEDAGCVLRVVLTNWGQCYNWNDWHVNNNCREKVEAVEGVPVPNGPRGSHHLQPAGRSHQRQATHSTSGANAAFPISPHSRITALTRSLDRQGASVIEAEAEGVYAWSVVTPGRCVPVPFLIFLIDNLDSFSFPFFPSRLC
jgi:hypothetical protein